MKEEIVGKEIRNTGENTSQSKELEAIKYEKILA